MQERASAGVERPFAVQQGQGRDGDGALAEAEGAHFPPHRADDQRSQSAGRGDIQFDQATSNQAEIVRMSLNVICCAVGWVRSVNDASLKYHDLSWV